MQNSGTIGFVHDNEYERWRGIDFWVYPLDQRPSGDGGLREGRDGLI